MPRSWDESELTFLDEAPKPEPRSWDESELEFLDGPDASQEPSDGSIFPLFEPPSARLNPETGKYEDQPRKTPFNDPARGRAALEMGGALGAALLTGGGSAIPSVLLRSLAASAGGFAGSLAAEPIDPTPFDPADLGPEPEGIIAQVGRLVRSKGSGALDRAIKTGATFGGGELVGGLVGAAAPALSRAAQTQSAKALGAIQGGFKRIGVARARRIGQLALDQGIVSPAATAEKMIARAGRLSNDAGKALGNLRKIADSLDEGVDALDVATRVEKALKDWRPGISEEALLKKHLDDTLNDILVFADPKTGKLNASALAELKKFLSDRVFTSPNVTAQNVTGRIKPRTNTARAQIQKAENDFIKGALSPDEFKEFMRLKRAYGDFQQAQQFLKERIARDISNNQVFGLSTQLGAILGAGAGGGPTGALGAASGAAITRILYQRGNQFSAKSLDALARLARSRLVTPASRAAAAALVESNRPQDQDRSP